MWRGVVIIANNGLVGDAGDIVKTSSASYAHFNECLPRKENERRAKGERNRC